MDGEPSGPRSSTDIGLKDKRWAVPLLVRNISGHATERDLRVLFEQAGPIGGMEMMPPVLVQGQPKPTYAWIQYMRQASADMAITYLQGFMLAGLPLFLEWAGSQDVGTQPIAMPVPVVMPSITPEARNMQALHTPTTCLYSVFVGDLDPEIDDTILAQTFSGFPSMYDARVIRDLRNGHSRGYGFVRLRNEREAMEAIANMSGQWVGSRIIRVNWAVRPSEPFPSETQRPAEPEQKVADSSSDSKTLYVGNLPDNANLPDIMNIFSSFGNVINAQMFPGRHYAFVTFQFSSDANKAWDASQSNPPNMAGQTLKVGWARYSTRNPSSRR